MTKIINKVFYRGKKTTPLLVYCPCGTVAIDWYNTAYPPELPSVGHATGALHVLATDLADQVVASELDQT